MGKSKGFMLGIHHIKSNWFSFRLLYLKWMIRVYALFIGLRVGLRRGPEAK